MEEILTAPLVPADLEPIELARRVFDAWRASAAHAPAEPLPAALAEIARTLLALHDVDEIVAALDVPRHVLNADGVVQPMPVTSAFVALPATAPVDTGAALDELVIMCTDGTVIRARGRIDAATLAAVVRDARAADDTRTAR